MPPDQQPFIRIRPARGWQAIPWKEIVAYKDFLYFLIIRSLKAKYAQSILGISWALIQPLFYMGIFSLIFGYFARLPSEGKPYALFTLSAIVPWSFFAAIVQECTQSLTRHANMVSKVYFPRIMLPVAEGMARSLDLLVGLAALVVVSIISGFIPSISWLWLLPALLMTLLSALGLGFFFSALSVLYRDIKYGLPFLLQILFIATPIFYSAEIVPLGFQQLYAVNPLVGIVAAFRAGVFGESVSLFLLIPGFVCSILLFLGGLYYFHRVETRFADAI